MDYAFPGWTLHLDKSTSASEYLAFDSSSQETNGCLVFNWHKKNRENNWVGSSLRFIWTLAKDEAGVVVYLNGSVQEGDKMKFNGVAYEMKRDKGKWSAVRKVELKQDTVPLGDDKFPGIDVTTSFKDQGIGNKWWDFLEEDGKKVKEGGDETKYGRWKWRGSNSGEITLDDWSPKLAIWGKYFFGEGNNKLDIDQLAMDIKGSWEKY